MIEVAPVLSSLPDVPLLLLLTLASIILFFIGVPILLVFGLWAVGFHFIVPVFNVSNVAIASYEEIQSFPFAAIPLFIIIGDLLGVTNMAEDIIEFSRSTIGWLPGSTGNTSLMSAGIFSAITGSNSATTAAIGRSLFPTMTEEGYKPPYSAALIAAGGTVGVIIPPSTLLILYGVTFGVSVPKLFLAGLIPGIAMVIAMLIVNTVVSYRSGYGIRRENFHLREAIRKFWKAKLGLSTIVILLGGIYGGIFTPAEASAIGVMYLLVGGIVSGRVQNVKSLVDAVFSTVILLGAIMPVVIVSILIQQNISYLGIQQLVSNAVIGLGHPILIMLGIMGVVLLAGSFLSSVPNLVLVAPLLAGAATQIGLSPIEWGILFMIGDAIGFITPPYGMNLYVISSITDIDYIVVSRHIIAFLASLLVVWLIFFNFPSLNLLA
jgi:C4-dicarboxylate transporter DctM subunit